MRWLALVVLAALVGCGSSDVEQPDGGVPDSGSPDSGTPDAGDLGSLEVTIDAPAGSTPAVVVSGPAGFQQTLSGSTTLSSLTPGEYVFSAPLLRAPGAVVATELEATQPAPVTVAAPNPAQVSITYVPRTGSGALWMGDQTLNLLESYSDADLVAAGDRPFHSYVDWTNSSLNALAFDAQGNLWLTDFSKVYEIARADLGQPATPTPVVTITLSDVASPAGLAFDPSGNLWVSNYALGSSGGAVARLGTSQLALTGAQTVTPEATLTGIDDPGGLAFGADGSLVATGHLGVKLFRFSPDQLTVSGSVATTPALEIEETGSCTTLCASSPWYLAFDASGNVWIADNFPGTTTWIYGFSAAALTATGVQQVDPDLGFYGTGMNNPAGVAFDEAGDLWVSNQGANTIQRYRASDIAGTGFPTLDPAATIHSSASATMSVAPIAFDPPPAALPIRR